MTTITAEEIIDRWEAVILALTPGSLADLKFHHCPKRYELRPWATKAGAGTVVTRAFDIRAQGERIEPPVTDLSVVYVTQVIRVEIAYSAKLVTLFGDDALDDLEDIAEDDATQIRNAITRGTGLAGAGHNASIVIHQELDRAHPEVWFQALDVEAQFYVSQSLTL